MGSNNHRGMLNLARVNPNGLTCFGMHLFGFSGCGVSGATESEACKGPESYSKTLNGGESVHRLISPHYPLVGRTLSFAVKYQARGFVPIHNKAFHGEGTIL